MSEKGREREREVYSVDSLVSMSVYSMQLLKSKEEEIEGLEGKLSTFSEQSRIVTGNYSAWL